MTFVILGAGEAGVQAALALRANGYRGSLVMVGDEHHVPYTRPPLSKSILTSASATLPEIYTAAALHDKGISLRLGEPVLAIDRIGKALEFASGMPLRYDKLVLATGSRARRLELSGAGAAGLRYLRTFDDALRLRAELRSGLRLVLVGGGYIGLEIAASARQRGCDVTVLEATDRVMARAVGARISTFFEDLHRNQGVRIRTGIELRQFVARPDDTEISCKNGEVIGADLIVVGIGAEPRDELAAKAGLAIDNGIVVDEFGRTSDPDVFACGDVANHPNPLLGRRLRLESWQNAQQQGFAVGAALAGRPRPYSMIPWFWSDQYDVNLQMIGCPARWDDEIVRGDPAQRCFTTIYLDQGIVVAANAVNRPRDVAPIRAAIGKRMAGDGDRLADPAVPLGQAFTEQSRSTEHVA